MGMTRATGGPVRCPWCARPVSDGPGSPEACPSCGIPLSPRLVGSRAPAAPAVAGRARKSQRLRALATVLALTAVMLIISAIGVAAAVLRADNSDGTAGNNLNSVAKAAEQMYRDAGSFAGADATGLASKAPGMQLVTAGVPSQGDREISIAVDGTSWYGAVRSHSGHCLALGEVASDPKVLEAVLPGNCTGYAAEATLMPVQPPGEVMSKPPAAVATGAPTSG